MTPFLKWPGGKRWFVANHSNLLPSSFRRYIEPFLGGGAVFFHVEPKKSILGDLNPELIDTYKAIRDDWYSLSKKLRVHQSNHSTEYYYAVRNSEPRSLTTRAARMIYLNRTCFNGIYRVNVQGRFNVPKGSKDKVLLDTDNFEGASELLAGAELLQSDFELIVEKARKDDFIFADPPYTVRHNVNGFLNYNERLFSWDDQVRLANALQRAKARGAMIVSTNANHESVRMLYEKRGFDLRVVSRFSAISAEPTSRKQFEELVIQAV